MAKKIREADWRLVAEVGDRFNETTDRQFDWWTTCFNEAISSMGGEPGVSKVLGKPSVKSFTTDDKISVSYWYPVCSLAALYGYRHDLRAVANVPEFSEPLINIGQFANVCRGGFQKQTLKRYINDLVQIRIIKKEGRGDNTGLMIALPAVNAWMRTQKQWASSFKSILDEMSRLGLVD
jgi:hypothetical protein